MASDMADSPSPVSDPHDANYDPKAEVAQTANSTPKSNITRGSRVSTDTREQLYGLAPAGRRCLLTLDTEPLECCHVIARATDHRTVEKLEYAWGMDPGTLHLHSTRNLLLLRSDMHARFDHNDWALIPTMEDLNMILTKNLVLPGQRPESYETLFPDRQWQYHFVTFRPSPKAFLRFLPNDTHQTHQYPYSGFELVDSHIHPYFAIYDAGKKVHHHRDTPDFDTAPEAAPHPRFVFKSLLASCERLYATWTSPVPGRSLAPPPMPQRPPTPSTRSLRSGSSGQGALKSRRDGGQDKPASGQKGKRSAQRPSGSQKQEDAGCPQMPVHSLPTPERSQTNAFSRQNSTQPAHEDDLPSCQRSRVRDWVGSVKIWELCVDRRGSKLAERYLAQYRQEETRRPPSGLWQEWVPEYELT